MTARTLNRRLAEITGWTNIIELGGALLGTPPAGEPECRGQAKVPDWEGDWRDCGPLMVEHDVYPDDLDCDQKLRAGYWEDMGHVAIVVDIADHPSKEQAARYVVVLAVIAKLEAGK